MCVSGWVGVGVGVGVGVWVWVWVRACACACARASTLMPAGMIAKSDSSYLLVIHSFIPCTCSHSLRNFQSHEYQEALRCLCTGCELWPDKGYDAGDTRFLKLFETTYESLGHAYWEVFDAL